jgi:Zinc finger, C3HC4 type (RING finger)
VDVQKAAVLAVQALMDASRDSPDNGYGECPICLEIMEKPYNTECDHTFCYECIVGLINSNNRSSAGCPMCRRTLTIKNIRAAPALIAPAPAPAPAPVVLSVPLMAPAFLKAAGGIEGGKSAGLVAMDVVSDVTSNSSDTLALKPAAAAAGAGAAEGEEDAEGEEAHVNILEDGLMTTKLRHLVSELRKVQTADSTAKCLVFSQFTQVHTLSLTDTISCTVICDVIFYASPCPMLSCIVL